MRVSVVINTHNRADSLRQVLHGLRYQTYQAFEVIVVHGPCTDSTEAMLGACAPDARVVRDPGIHLGKSRNLGIRAASGEVVAFLDDDAIPDPQWIEELVAGYDSERVAGVGGPVYDHTGYTLQRCPRVCNRRGTPLWDIAPPFWEFQHPRGDAFVHLMGCNCSFRRRCLEEVGGFDEEIERFLDETELCLRLVDQGYWLRNLPGPVVYHKHLPGHLRGADGIHRKPFAIVKNKFYVALRNRRPQDAIDRVLEECWKFADDWLRHTRQLLGTHLSPAQLSSYERDLYRGVWKGMVRGQDARRFTAELPPADPEAFRTFATLSPPTRRLTICMATQDLPAGCPGGIARFTMDLAEGLAALGHEIHVLTRAAEHNSVDLENGVWIHRLLDQTDGPWTRENLPPLVVKNLNRAAAVHREVRRIAETRTVDLVSTPLWDCEGLFCLLDDSLACVLTLHTPLQTLANLYAAWRASPEIGRMLELERLTLQAARFIYSNSQSILETIRADYQAPGPEAQAFVIPHGVSDRTSQYQSSRTDNRCRVLFVGRLEKRKGVDLFLEGALRLAPLYPHVDFYLVGDDTIPCENGATYRSMFDKQHGQEPAARQVFFLGKVSDAELYQHYADCDLFCLPARYESFGLVLVEAMAFGKPVVACAAGGMREVVAHEQNGFLAPSPDVDALTGYLRRLIDDAALRCRFGAASRRLYEERFSTAKMVERTVQAYTDIVERLAA